ncbi:DUF4434 domain-containing protein [Azorhizobium sp. AG788]|uniref:DUF4434 domain-containing protein n=1 Tax=Azorhizobium sp. AG788 TaxID=2183897 RepID=UPI003138C920
MAGGAGLALAASAPRTDRLPRRLDGSFLQVWKDDLTLPRPRWAERLRQMKVLGCQTLVLQWTALGTAYAMSDPLLDALMDLALAAGLGVRVGLPHQEGYWPMLAAPDLAVRAGYFVRATDAGTRILQGSRLSAHPAFSGWYVPYEIEQVNWADAERRGILARYLAALAKANDSGIPLAISTFRSALPDVKTLADLWGAILDEVPVRLMVQDGVGIFGMGNYRHLAPLFALLRARGSDFDTVVELFTEIPSGKTDGTTFSAVPATMVRLRAQLAAAADTGAQSLIGFAVHPYMTDASPAATQLRAAYARALGNTGFGI